jgi:Protein of unknown function (DUF2971)
MRVYHFLSAQNALDDLTNRRIKLSEIDKLNDPFELWCSAQDDQHVRVALRLWKEEIARRFGILCFTKDWGNPVLWSHYADGHRGICLGFDVPAKGLLKPIQYVRERTSLPIPPTFDAMDKLLFTKYSDWSYEKEWRGWFQFDERDASGHYFFSFDEKVKLREVIGGPLCTVSKDTLDAAAANYEGISVIKARLAFRTFQIVENQRGFST